MLDEQTRAREAALQKIADKAMMRQGNFLETVVAKEQAKEAKSKAQLDAYVRQREESMMRKEKQKRDAESSAKKVMLETLAE